MKSIWVIEDGEYSDYHIIGVFSSKEGASLVQARTGGTVAEWPLDPAVSELRAGLSRWRVLMLRDGTAEKVEVRDTNEYIISSADLAGEAMVWRRSIAPFFRGRHVADCLDAAVWANSPAHAVKIANEKRAQLIASGQWPDSDD